MFLHWIALHEATHAFQFASVPWLRGHLGGMVEELLDGATLGADLATLRENLKRMVSRPDPRRLAVELRDEGLSRWSPDPLSASCSAASRPRWR